MDSEPVQQVNAWTNLNIGLFSFGALAFQICEFVYSFFDEAEYLFRSRFTVVKSLVNLALNHKMNEGPMRVHLCVGAFIYKPILAQQTLMCLEIILLIRVYALYGRSRRIKYFLCAAFLTHCVIETWGNSQIIKVVIKGKSCTPGLETVPLAAMVVMSVSGSCFQVLILCMTVFKYVVGHHSGWARTPLTSLVLREGIAVCSLLLVISMVNILTYTSIHGLEYGDVALSWYLTLISVTGCRLILDMRRLAVSRPAPFSDGDDEIEFTSNLDMT